VYPARLIQLAISRIQEAAEYFIEFPHAAPALPDQPVTLAISGCGDCLHQMDRLTINSLMWPIACVGFSPLGQTSTQFMMV